MKDRIDSEHIPIEMHCKARTGSDATLNKNRLTKVEKLYGLQRVMGVLQLD